MCRAKAKEKLSVFFRFYRGDKSIHGVGLEKMNVANVGRNNFWLATGMQIIGRLSKLLWTPYDAGTSIQELNSKLLISF